MQALPVDELIPQIVELLKNHQNLVISAAPGAGKTTRVPVALIKNFSGQILVLEPRRLAATAAAGRISEEQKWTLGMEVGYQVRFEAKANSETRLIFLTEALLQKKILESPDLSKVQVVILDEFHERSIHTDLALGLLKEIQELSRPDLKIVIMSATIDAKPIQKFLSQCAAIEVPGQIFPLEIKRIKTSQKIKTDWEFISFFCENVKLAQKNLKLGRHLLAFLPGVGEIEQCFDQLKNWAMENNLELHTLHGSLPLNAQKTILAPTSKSKIILATNVAESSITIDGTEIVVDSGLVKRSSFNSKTGYLQLETVRISKASATQRAGRAARQGPGQVFQLWNELDERSMNDFETAEIFRTDLSEAYLLLASLEISNVQNFSWFENPATDRLEKAKKSLIALGALTETGHLSSLGKEILRISASPRIAKLLLTARKEKMLADGIDIAVILSERLQPKSVHDSHLWDCDICNQLEKFRIKRSHYQDRIRQGFARQMNFQEEWNSTELSESEVKKVKRLLFLTFADQIAKKRNSTQNKALLITGRGVEIDKSSAAKDSEFFVCLQLMDGVSNSDTKVNLASGFSKEELLQIPEFNQNIQDQEWLEFDEEIEKVVQKKARSFVLNQNLKLALQEPFTSAAPQSDSFNYLLEALKNKSIDWLLQNSDFANWYIRLQFYENQIQRKIVDQQILQRVWPEVSFGAVSFAEILKKDIVFFVENQIEMPILQDFKACCPTELTVPSGSKIKLQYESEQVKLEVRLQEVFGWTESPTIMKGKYPVTLVLLGPHYRPVQVTRDLVSFWKTSYFEVKKDLKTRYPKHSWPDNPLTAIAQAKGRPTKN